jgi:hypothetical protein
MERSGPIGLLRSVVPDLVVALIRDHPAGQNVSASTTPKARFFAVTSGSTERSPAV